MIDEAFFALEASIARAKDIDRSCMKGLGFPLGPLVQPMPLDLIFSLPA